MFVLVSLLNLLNIFVLIQSRCKLLTTVTQNNRKKKHQEKGFKNYTLLIYTFCNLKLNRIYNMTIVYLAFSERKI